MKLRVISQAAVGCLCLLSLSAQASAERPALAKPYPAIATGLAIPVGAEPRSARPAALADLPQRGRAVLVDAASARLFMIEDGRVRDSMKVIVGKPEAATPELRGTLFYATVNPYWNVPVDLAQTLIAPRVLDQGRSYLDQRGYEVVTGFDRDARRIDPDSVDWEAVARGKATVHVRQRPGPANSMGRVKFGFDNDDGIFLHDTPRKELFEAESRALSNGCVRLEDADRFAAWLMGGDVPLDADRPERHLPLPAAVPIVIAYLGDRQQIASLD